MVRRIHPPLSPPLQKSTLTLVNYAYCRACDKRFRIATAMQEFLIEALSDGNSHYHPRVDCDIESARETATEETA